NQPLDAPLVERRPCALRLARREQLLVSPAVDRANDGVYPTEAERLFVGSRIGERTRRALLVHEPHAIDAAAVDTQPPAPLRPIRRLELSTLTHGVPRATSPLNLRAGRTRRDGVRVALGLLAGSPRDVETVRRALRAGGVDHE